MEVVNQTMKSKSYMEVGPRQSVLRTTHTHTKNFPRNKIFHTYISHLHSEDILTLYGILCQHCTWENWDNPKKTQVEDSKPLAVMYIHSFDKHTVFKKKAVSFFPLLTRCRFISTVSTIKKPFWRLIFKKYDSRLYFSCFHVYENMAEPQHLGLWLQHVISIPDSKSTTDMCIM